MKTKYLLFTLALFILFIIAILAYVKILGYKVQISSLTTQLDSSRADTNKLTYDENALQIKYSACIYDQMVSSSLLRRTISFQDLGIYSPLLATQSGSMDAWDYKGATQTEYQANLTPYNQLYILVADHTTKFPYIKSRCENSPIDSKTSVCSVQELNIAEYIYKGLTKNGLPYYQNNPPEIRNTPNIYVTYMLLPQTEKQENRSVQISYNGKITDAGYQQYLSLVQEINTKPH